MARKCGRDRTKLLAKLVTENRAPCAFCQRDVDDEITYGKLYAIGSIQCHYFCVLLSCCLVQKGKDTEGLFGFLYPDILAELERSKKHRCSYCSKGGATLGCCVSACRKQFHLPCGRERNAVSLFYGNYKSFCQLHAPKQHVTADVMAKAKLRMKEKKKMPKNHTKEEKRNADDSLNVESVCVICYEEVECYPTVQTFWPPCCARDAWFHRTCLQRMALSAGIHYLKCPLCNDKESFYQAVVSQGYYVPDRDAAWELEQNAFSEIYERPIQCGVDACLCPEGRSHDQDTGPWDIKLCLLCGSTGAHAACLQPETRLVCRTCKPAAPEDITTLARAIDAVIQSEQASRNARVNNRPIMPARMSLRRTKQRTASHTASSSTSQHCSLTSAEVERTESQNITSSRQELNLKTPRRQNRQETILKDIENRLLSPKKLLEQGLREKARSMGASETENIVIDETIVERLRQRFRKPKPLSAKKKIVEGVVEDLFKNVSKEINKVKEPIKEWNSPKKEVTQQDQEYQSKENTDQQVTKSQPTDVTENTNIESDNSNSTIQLPAEFVADHKSDDSLPIFDTPKKLKTVEIQKDSSMEISENNDVINIDLVKIENQNSGFLKNFDLREPVKGDCAFKFSPKDKNTLKRGNIDIDIESFKNHYLSEVDRDFKCKFQHRHSGSDQREAKLKTAIDFAMEAATSKKENRKRKLKLKKKAEAKKMKVSDFVLKYEDDTKRKKKNKKNKTKLSITNDKMKVKISLKKEKFKLKITQTETPKTLKQYVLKYANNSTESIEKPEREVTPIKRKYVKQEKSPDNLVQTSIQNFFKTKSPKD